MWGGGQLITHNLQLCVEIRGFDEIRLNSAHETDFLLHISIT